NVFVYCYGTKIHGVYSLSRTTSVENISVNTPGSFSLEQNYPNPFNPFTTISFNIQVPSFTSLKIYDVVGRETATLVNKNLSAGSYEVKFDASQVPSGVYFYTLQTAHYSETKKMILTK
ncbi:MAG TPA: T9SS C-terminal target domain-containing protein, partial [Bacteroidetes bacterium]|nr:T9SS C-terminal target domain-containing protein [Bacteroidota bacterium]